MRHPPPSPAVWLPSTVGSTPSHSARPAPGHGAMAVPGRNHHENQPFSGATGLAAGSAGCPRIARERQN